MIWSMKSQVHRRRHTDDFFIEHWQNVRHFKDEVTVSVRGNVLYKLWCVLKSISSNNIKRLNPNSLLYFTVAASRALI